MKSLESRTLRGTLPWTLTLLAVLARPAVGDEKPSLRVAKVTQPPTIDGVLDDSAWKEATKITTFHLVGSRGTPSEPTEAWLASDGQFIYLALRCDDARIHALSNRVTQRDGPVNQDDSVELFLDPGTGGDTYFHFKLSVGNVQADQLCIRGQTHPEWNAGWQSATFVDPVMATSKAWTAEMAIPLYVLRQRAWGGPWHMNVTRNKRTSPAEFSSWAPVEGGFHEPQRFGTLVGLSDMKPSSEFAPLVVSTGVSRYRVVDGKYVYDVFGDVINDGGRPGTVEIVAEDRPATGATVRATQKLSLGPLEGRTFRVFVPIARPGQRKTALVLRDPTSGRVWHRVEVAGMEALNPLRAYLDRNYYTDEEKARALAAVAMDDSECRQAGLRLTYTLLGQNGQTLFSAEGPASADEFAIALPLGKVSAGEHSLRVRLLDRAGAELGEAPLALIRRAAAPPGATEVKIDQENRCLLVEGKPFFPIGICSTAMDADTLAMYRDCGFNTLIRWWGIGRDRPIASAMETLDAAQSHGLYVIELPLAFLRSKPGHAGLLTPEAFRQAVREMPELLRAVRAHPAVLAYYGLDEAPGSGPLAEPLCEFLRTVRALDPYRPVYISGGGATSGLSPGSALTKPRFDFADILGAHSYWCPMGAEGSDTPNAMARDARNAFENVTEPHQRPLFIIPQSEITSWSRRALTPQERRITVYLALVHGAKAMIYFASPVAHRSTAENMKELSGELRALAPALLTRTPPQEIRVDPPPGDDGLPLVQALLKDGPEGGALLIAANSSPSRVQAQWDLSRLGHGLKVSDFFSRKPLGDADGSLTDAMEGYATRVYLIQGGHRKRGQKTSVHVTLAGEAVDRVQQRRKPDAESPRRNLLANHSFEAGEQGWRIQGKGVTSSTAGRSGSRCLRIVKAEGKSAVTATSDPIPLRPNTAYRFGGWLWSELTEGRIALSFYLQERSEEGKRRLGAGLPCPPVHGEWKRFARQIPTPDVPVTATFWCQVPYGTTGEIRLDDVFVEEVPPEPEPVHGKNLIQNSSFEEAALPGWPDAWRIGAVKPGHLIGDADGPGQDPSCPFHGKYALRIANPFDQASGYARAQYVHAFAARGASRGGIPVEIGKTYVFSVYLRAEKPGTAAVLSLYNFVWSSLVDKEGVSKRFRLTTDWRRYEVACTIPREGWTRGLRPEVTVFIQSQAVTGPIWADAAQLEEGSQATPYTVDNGRAANAHGKSEPGRVGPEKPGPHAPALVFSHIDHAGVKRDSDRALGATRFGGAGRRPSNQRQEEKPP